MPPSAVRPKRRSLPHRLLWLAIPMALFVLAAPEAFASEDGHTDPVSAVVLGLAAMLLAAKLGGDVAVRLKQPAVLGELVMGVLLGNLAYIGIHHLDALKTDPSIDMLARIGVLILLFEVGLESTVAQMLKVGWSSLLVAVLGVAAPFGLGWGVGMLLLPNESVFVWAFLGAALTATSVGITARVLKDLEKQQTSEARVILGAAVIDDVLGLVILAVVTGVIGAHESGGTLSTLSIGWILLKALLFLVGSLAIGILVSPKLFGLASTLQARGVLLAVGLSFCFILSWIANLIGLAPIVGAFAAGLILEDVHYRKFTDRGENGLEHIIEPISAFLVPIFFVLMGMHTDLGSFADPSVLGLALALTAAAILGKQVCGLGVLDKGTNRLTVGIGMIPRGEVGLIFANIGLTLVVDGHKVVNASTYSAVVVVVIATTMVSPPALKWALNRAEKAKAPVKA